MDVRKLNIGEWVFDAATRRLRHAGHEARLSPKAAGVLHALAETPAQVWSRDALLERVWSGTTVGEEVLTHAIAEIRKALQDDFRHPRFIETVHKGGYRLLAPQPRRAGASIPAKTSDRFEPATVATYLSACYHWERGGRTNIDAAIGLFSSAIRSDPHFAPAHVGLAKALTFLDCDHPTDLDEALNHCLVAQTLRPDYADAYAVEGLVAAIAGDLGRSSRSFKTAVALQPDNPETLYLFARVCMALVELAPAAVMLERCANLRAGDYHATLLAGKVRHMLGEERVAHAHFLRALPRIEARLASHHDDFRALSDKARCLWNLHRADEAHAITEHVATHPEPTFYQLACVLASAGHAQGALDVLEAAAGAGWRYRGWLDRDPDFDNVRTLPRFQRICASMERI